MELRIAGLLLLLAGWIIMVSALVLLASAAPQIAFGLAGFLIEGLGFVLLARTHISARKKQHA